MKIGKKVFVSYNIVILFIVAVSIGSCQNKNVVETTVNVETSIVEETEESVIDLAEIIEERTFENITYEKDLNGNEYTTVKLANNEKKKVVYDALMLDEYYDIDASIEVDIGDENSVSGEFKNYVRFVDGDIELMAGSIYVLKGELNGGQIRIIGNAGERVQIVLDGVNINTSKEFAICSPFECMVLIRLNDNTENHISYLDLEEDSKKKKNTKPKKMEAAILVNSSLTFTGKGVLDIGGSFKNAIECGDALTFISGNYIINGTDDGIKGNVCVIIKNGSFNINVEADAIKAMNDIRGFIFIERSEMNIDSYGKGVSAPKELIFAGGNIHIDSKKECIEGKTVDIINGNYDLKSGADCIKAYNIKDINNLSGVYVRLAGGIINIDSWFDGIDSNGNLYFEGADVNISGPTRHAEKIINYNGNVYLEKGDIIALGASKEVKNLGYDPVQNYIIVYYNNARPKGSAYQVVDEADNVLMSFTPAKDYRVAILSSNKLKIGQTYNLISMDDVNKVTIMGKITISDFRK